MVFGSRWAGASLLAAGVMFGTAGFALAQGGQAPGPVGLWLDDDGKAGIQIDRCDKFLCGKIIWLKDPNDKDGKPFRDAMNPDTSKRDKPVCGLQIMGELKRETDGTFNGGWVYDPEEGKKYSIEIMVKDPQTISLLVFEGEKAKSQTMDWKRLPDNQPRCK